MNIDNRRGRQKESLKQSRVALLLEQRQVKDTEQKEGFQQQEKRRKSSNKEVKIKHSYTYI
jgi:topoisomerase IA-like protein